MYVIEPTVIRPNEQRPDWPQRKDFKKQDEFDKALAAVKKSVPFYGHPYDDNLDWREMVWNVISILNPIRPVWIDPANLSLVHEGKTVMVMPKLHLVTRPEYTYITWDVKEQT